MNPQFSGPPPSYTGHPGYSTPPPVLATFADRLIAYIIDSAIIGAISFVYTIPLMIYVSAQAVSLSGPAGTADNAAVGSYLISFFVAIFVIFVLGVAVSYLYHVEFVLKNGQTIGKRVVKLHIVRVGELPGHGLSRGTAVKRWGATLGLALLPGGSYLDGLWQLWDKPFQQCIHDKAAETTVVKVSPVSSTASPGGVIR